MTRCPVCKTILGLQVDCEDGAHLYCQMCEQNLIWDAVEKKFEAMRTKIFDFLPGKASAYVY